MLKLLVLFSIFISCSMSMTLRSEPVHMDQEMKTSEILVDKAKDANGYRTFNVMGKLYKAKLHSQQMNMQMMMMGDDQKMEKMQSGGSHEMYLGENEDSSFTVSTHVNEKGESVQIVRGNIFNQDHEVVLEPVMVQRRNAMEDEGPRPGPPPEFKEAMIMRRSNGEDPRPEPPPPPPEPMTKVYSRSLDRFKEYQKSKAEYAKSEEFQKLKTSSVGQTESVLRSRRATGPVNNYVEMLSVFDYPFYSYATQLIGSTADATVASFLEGYACQVINVANLGYQRSFANITSLKITVQPKLFVILKNSAISDFTTKSANLMTVNGATTNSKGRKYINSGAALNDANAWLIRHINGGNLVGNSFDSAVFFTGQDMATSSGPNIIGLAPMQGTCTNGQRGFLVEDKLGLEAGMTLAHELAHNLGVPHDLDNNPSGSASCTDSANYIMSTSRKWTNMGNSFYFSPCSISKLVSVIVTNNLMTCLANSYTLPTDVNTFLTQFYPGQLYNLTEQCRMNFDSTYFPFFYKYNDGTYAESTLCQALYCTKNGQSSSSWGPALDKTTCGSGKWCEAGVCTSNSNVGTGQCIIEDDVTFCNNMVASFGKTTVCSYWHTGRCCKFCNSAAVVVPRISTSTISNMITKAAGTNTFVWSATTTPCVDMSWCSYVNSWKTTTPDICTSGYTYNGYLIQGGCPKTCGIC